MSKKIKLWTEQPIEVYHEILKTGKYICDPEKSSDYPVAQQAYHWISNQLEKKDPRPEGVTLPVWALYKWEGSTNPKYYLHHSTHEIKPTALISLEIDESRILQSDYDLWYFPYVNAFIDLVPFNSFGEQFSDRVDFWLSTLSKENQQLVKERSWEIVFTQKKIRDYTNNDSIQAVFWELKKEDIKDVEILYPNRLLNTFFRFFLSTKERLSWFQYYLRDYFNASVHTDLKHNSYRAEQAINFYKSFLKKFPFFLENSDTSNRKEFDQGVFIPVGHGQKSAALILNRDNCSKVLFKQNYLRRGVDKEIFKAISDSRTVIFYGHLNIRLITMLRDAGFRPDRKDSVISKTRKGLFRKPNVWKRISEDKTEKVD